MSTSWWKVAAALAAGLAAGCAYDDIGPDDIETKVFVDDERPPERAPASDLGDPERIGCVDDTGRLVVLDLSTGAASMGPQLETRPTDLSYRADREELVVVAGAPDGRGVARAISLASGRGMQTVWKADLPGPARAEHLPDATVLVGVSHRELSDPDPWVGVLQPAGAVEALVPTPWPTVRSMWNEHDERIAIVARRPPASGVGDPWFTMGYLDETGGLRAGPRWTLPAELDDARVLPAPTAGGVVAIAAARGSLAVSRVRWDEPGSHRIPLDVEVRTERVVDALALPDGSSFAVLVEAPARVVIVDLHEDGARVEVVPLHHPLGPSAEVATWPRRRLALARGELVVATEHGLVGLALGSAAGARLATVPAWERPGLGPPILAL